MYIKDITELREKFVVLYEQAKRLLEYSPVDVNVIPHKETRSIAQNNYYWKLCTELAQFFQEHDIYDEYDAFGIHIKRHYTKDSVHDKLNKPLVGVDSTRKLSIQEFNEYMTKIIAYWQDVTHGEWMPSEMPMSYLRNRGYTEEYTKGYINDKDV